MMEELQGRTVEGVVSVCPGWIREGLREYMSWKGIAQINTGFGAEFIVLLEVTLNTQCFTFSYS